MTDRRRLAHDVRNGLNSLALNTQCLGICEGEEAIEYLDAILEATDSIVLLMDTLAKLPDDAANPAPTS